MFESFHPTKNYEHHPHALALYTNKRVFRLESAITRTDNYESYRMVIELRKW